jgi:hypothetical protein
VTDCTPSGTKPTLRLSIELNPTISQKPAEKIPSVRLTSCHAGAECVIGDLRTDVDVPCVAVEDHAFAMVEAQNVLSRVMDEGAWLRELWRITMPGGQLRLTVPAGGPLAWLDAHNIYRYLTDITGRGTPPSATLPTGWHRHYHADEIWHLVEKAGFTIHTIERIGIGIAELPHLAGYVLGDYLLKIPMVEHHLHHRRTRLERLDEGVQLPKIGKMLYVLATRP